MGDDVPRSSWASGMALLLALVALVLVSYPVPCPCCELCASPARDTTSSTTGTTDPLDNLDFEVGGGTSTLRITPSGTYTTTFQEINPPQGWTAFWYEGFECSANPDWVMGRPEVCLASTYADPYRVHSGLHAVKFFTFWRCHKGGLLAQAPVQYGLEYKLSAWGHAWFSRCSSFPHLGFPLEFDCILPVTWAHLTLQVGIDPLGGTDPSSPAIAWSPPREIYGLYQYPLSVSATALTSTITLYLLSDADNPLKHVDAYWDDLAFYAVRSTVYIPIVIKEEG